ncbi:fibronectin type III domain-containing protein [Bacteroidota bacterium]
MAEVKADIAHINIPEKVDVGKARVEALTGNLEVPVDAGKLTDYSTSVDNLETANQDADAALTNYNSKIIAKNAADAEYKRQTNLMVNEINSITDDEAKLITTGFPLSEVGGTAPPVVLVKVENVSATVGDEAGEADVHWDSQTKIDGYGIEYSPDSGFPEANTKEKGVGRTSKYTLTGLSSGDYIWVRVRAKKGDLEGPPSDPATTIVP